MRPIKRLERRELILGESQKIESIVNIDESITLNETSEQEQTNEQRSFRLTFLDKKEVEFNIIEETNDGYSILELVHSDIKKYKEGSYLVRTDDIKDDSSIEIFEITGGLDNKTSMGNTKKVINIKRNG